MADKDIRPRSTGDQWLDDFLAAKESEPEIGADEQAVFSAGLTHPDDLELEQIMKEVSSDNWVSEPDSKPQPEAPKPAPIPEPAPEPETFKDEEFREAFGEGKELEQVFRNDSEPSAPVPESDVVEEEQPMEKGRPKKEKTYRFFGLSHVAVTAIWLAIIVFVGVSVGRLGWLCASDVLALGRTPISATVTIDPEDDIDAIAKKLQDANLIHYPGLFKIYASITEAMEDIKPGTYNFKSVSDSGETLLYDYMALVNVISPSSGSRVIVEDLRIPEGYTCAQIFKLLEEKKVCTAAALEEYAANGELSGYWFLKDVARGDKYCLEGYLFPDTYDFYENDDPGRVIRKMLNAFDASFSDKMKDELTKLDGYDLRQVIIIASMIEKESANDAESFTVSSVIYNRLNKSHEYPYLNFDSTLVYALGKTELTADDLKSDHPYNTHTNKGLPPGPISNPSQNSIAAALDPEDTDYHFFMYDPSTNRHHFSKTYQEHLDFIESLRGEQ